MWQYRDASSDSDNESSGALPYDDLDIQGHRDLGKEISTVDDDDLGLDTPFTDYAKAEDVESGEITKPFASCPKLEHRVSKLRYYTYCI